MNSKKILAAVSALAMCGTLFTACSGGNSSSETTTAAGNDTTAAAGEDTAAAEGGDETTAAVEADTSKTGTIKFLHHRTDMDTSGDMAELLKGFTDKYPGVTIEAHAYTNYADDVATMMQSDDYGDVVMTPQAIKQSDLPNFFASLGSKSDMENTYYWTTNYSVGDDVYALATAGTASGILYNKQVWSDAGITDLPNTPDGFIDCLKKISEKTSAIPYYTNYNDRWCIVQWQSLVVSASGDPSYNVRVLTDKEELFSDGSPYDTVYGLLFDIYSDPALVEADHAGTNWEGCKTAFAQGQIGSMVLGSWAISQFQQAAEDVGVDPSVVGYMPLPANVDGKIYSLSSNDYCMSVNKNSKDVDLAKEFVYWFVDDSGFAAGQGMISTKKGAPMPDTLSAFDELDVQLFTEDPVPDELVGKFNEIDKDSEVDTWGDAATNFKFQMAEAAFKGEGRDKYKEICDSVNAAWDKTRDEVLADYYAAQ